LLFLKINPLNYVNISLPVYIFVKKKKKKFGKQFKRQNSCWRCMYTVHFTYAWCT